MKRMVALIVVLSSATAFADGFSPFSGISGFKTGGFSMLYGGFISTNGTKGNIDLTFNTVDDGATAAVPGLFDFAVNGNAGVREFTWEVGHSSDHTAPNWTNTLYSSFILGDPSGSYTLLAMQSNRLDLTSSYSGHSSIGGGGHGTDFVGDGHALTNLIPAAGTFSNSSIYATTNIAPWNPSAQSITMGTVWSNTYGARGSFRGTFIFTNIVAATARLVTSNLTTGTVDTNLYFGPAATNMWTVDVPDISPTNQIVFIDASSAGATVNFVRGRFIK